MTSTGHLEHNRGLREYTTAELNLVVTRFGPAGANSLHTGGMVYDSTVQAVKVYNGTDFVALGGCGARKVAHYDLHEGTTLYGKDADVMYVKVLNDVDVLLCGPYDGHRLSLRVRHEQCEGPWNFNVFPVYGMPPPPQNAYIWSLYDLEYAENTQSYICLGHVIAYDD